MKLATCTTTHGTETAEGFIPHCAIPERTDDGRLVYALPGGGWFAQ